MNEQRPHGPGQPPPAFPPYAPPPWPPYPGHHGAPAAPPGSPPAVPLPMPAAAPYPGAAVPARSNAWIWGLLGSLMLMGALVLGAGAWALTSGPQAYGDDARLDRMWDACERGDMGACDRLYEESPLFSDYEEFGLTCGGRGTDGFTCAS